MKKRLYFLLFFFTLFSCTTVLASGNDWFEKDYNFTAVPSGQGKLNIKLLVWTYGSGHNHWASDKYYDGGHGEQGSYIEYSDDNDATWHKIFKWKGDNDVNKYQKQGKAWFKGCDDSGKWTVSNAADGSKPTYDGNGTQHEASINHGGGERQPVWLELVWYPSQKFDGKTIHMRVHVCDERSNDHWNYTYDWGNYAMADAIPAPELYTPALYATGSDPSSCGYAMIPYSVTKQPKSYTTSYSSAVIPLAEMGGTILETTTDSVKRGYLVKMTVKRNDASTVVINSAAIDIPAYHRVYDFNVSKYMEKVDDHDVYLGHKQISWMVKKPKEEDLVESDMFEIQRAYKENFEDAVSIAIVNYNTDIITDTTYTADTYTYVYNDESDEAIYNRLDRTAPVYYRVRRTSSSNWGWDTPFAGKGSLYAPIYQTSLHCGYGMYVGGWSIRKSDTFDSDHKVTIIGKEISADTYNDAWWDERATLILTRTAKESGVVKDIVIPFDSIKRSYKSYEKIFTWSVSFNDELPSPCQHYTYGLRIDTTATRYLVFKNQEYQLDTIPVKNNEPLYFATVPEFAEFTASDNTYNEYVLLNWTMLAGGTDYFIIEREYDGKKEILEEHYKGDFYKDTKAAPSVKYKYTVTAVLNCSGESKTSISAYGSRSPYGTVNGHVRFSNGISQSGVQVDVVRTNDATDWPQGIDEKCIKNKYTIYTEADGSFTIDSIVYALSGSNFDVQPVSQYGEFYYEGAKGGIAKIEMNANVPVSSNIDFTNAAFVRVTGRVLFENSTIPVQNAYFMIDGNAVTNESGNLILSDASGNFAITAPKEQSFRLQVAKAGHHFVNDGYLKIEGKDVISLEKNLDGVRLWDSTRIRLIGRLAGGDIQASKPLGFGLSKNNIGDDLQMIFELEGDNISHIIQYDDLSITEKDTVFKHPVEGQSTKAMFTAKRIVVKPDITTGEYMVELPPVKYKIVQATATGYSTLFPNGKTSEVIDLTNSVTTDTLRYESMVLPYNDIYKLTYKAAPQISYQQIRYGTPSQMFGEEKMIQTTLEGKRVTIPVCYTDKTGNINYVFGYPVYNGGNTYSFGISAFEGYYYNNDKNNTADVVPLGGNLIKIYNGLTYNAESVEYMLDEKGSITVSLPVDNNVFTLDGEDALRSLNVSVLVSGKYVEANPLQAYVTGSRSKGKDFIQHLGSKIICNDVLRDPPGTNSYAYRSKGTKYSTTYTCNFDMELGTEMTFSYGSNMSTLAGIQTPATFNGVSMQTSSALDLPLKFTQTMHQSNTYTYNVELSDKIQTGDDVYNVGPDADIYIGSELCATVGRNDAFTVINDSTYKVLEPAVKSGAVRHVASGTDKNGDTFHLVVAETLVYTPGIKSTFYYTQKHILTVILPNLFAERNKLIRNGSESDLQTLADNTGKSVYMNICSNPDSIGMKGSYKWLKPKKTSTPALVDEVQQYNDLMLEWTSIIENNEKALVNGTFGATVLANLSVSAGTHYTHTEQASVSRAYQLYQPNTMGGTGMQLGSNLLSALKYSSKLGKSAGTLFRQLQKAVGSASTARKQARKVEGFAPGQKWSFNIVPIVDLSQTQSNEESLTNTYETGFYIDPGVSGYLNVTVFRLTNNAFNDSTNVDWRTKAFDVTPSAINDPSFKVADYVYYVNGGATRCPYEGERATIFYRPNTVTSNATQNIHEAHLKIDKNEVSDVPQDEAAVFNLTLWEESDTNEGLYEGYMNYVLFVDDETNSKGAKLSIDGAPLTSRTFTIARNKPFNKVLEVRRGGSDYDFEDITLLLLPECDCNINNFSSAAKVVLSVHFMPEAGDVNISTPSDNWVLNTFSPKDSTGYYLPIVIDGFDVNYDNFDHIELQYKLATHSDDNWVTLGSYYADPELYDKASGNKGMITGGRIENIHFYGERDPMEQMYNLRAVSFCRHGSSFITKSSKVLTGIKDTKCPQLFGSVLPKNGILGVGDYISIPFSEDIAGNYLDEDNNFEILGFTNSGGLKSSTSLQFTDTENSYAVSNDTRNLSDKDFSIDMMVWPDNSNTHMTYFAVETDDVVEFGQTEDGCLYANIGGKFVKSKPFDPMLTFTRVILTYDSQTGNTKFYVGNKDITDSDFITVKNFRGVGKIYLGRSLESQARFKGRMFETRLWIKELTQGEITVTGNRRLTGYERDLLAYYPMTEGKGRELKDKANGNNAVCNNTSWNVPDGLSVQFKGEDGLKLKGDKFSRTEYQDFSLSFWFRTHGKSTGNAALFAAGRGDSTELSAEDKLFIGFEDGILVLRQNGKSITTNGTYDDGEWHHYALTVNRTFNIGGIFIDGKSLNQFDASLIHGLASSDVYLGACHWFTKDESGAVIEKEDKCLFKGYIAHLAFWESALSGNFITGFYNLAPTGKELNLLCYLPFSRRVESSAGVYETVFSPLNGVYTMTTNGEYVLSNDTIIVTDIEKAKQFASKEKAPVVESSGITKMNFSWMGNGNQLVVNLNMLDSEINKNNIFINVRNVEDLHGNQLVNPITTTLFVDRNHVKWAENKIDIQVPYKETAVFDARIMNIGSTTAVYVIDGMSEWLTTDDASSTVGPNDYKDVRFTIGNTLDVGEHTNIIYLTDQNGLSEPYIVKVHVVADEPEWNVDKNKYRETMNLYGVVMLKDKGESATPIFDKDKDDYVAAFIDGECVGKQNIGYENNKSYLYMTIYGYEPMQNKSVRFTLWRAREGRIYQLDLSENVVFKENAVVGSADNPVVLTTSLMQIQSVPLASGWNWVSFNLKPFSSGHFYDAFCFDYTFAKNDMIKTYNEFSTFNGSQWYGTLGNFNHKRTYMFRVESQGSVGIMGNALTSEYDRTILLHHGWNWMPYLCTNIRTVAEALSNYYDNAAEGDIIKSHSEFAMMTKDHKWVGSLTHLRPGEGYMLYRNNLTDVNFMYAESPVQSSEPSALRTAFAGSYAENMPVIAIATLPGGERSVEGDLLQAYDNDELVGECQANEQGVFFLMTSAKDNAGLKFSLTRNGEQRTAPEIINFSSDKFIGTVEDPYDINFNASASATPSPFTDHIDFSVTAKEGDIVCINVYGSDGKCVLSHSEQALSEHYSYTFSGAGSFATGIYSAVIRVQDKTYNFKLIKK